MTISNMKSLVDCTGLDLAVESSTVTGLASKLDSAYSVQPIAYLINMTWNGMIVTPTMAIITVSEGNYVLHLTSIAEITVTSADAVTISILQEVNT